MIIWVIVVFNRVLQGAKGRRDISAQARGPHTRVEREESRLSPVSLSAFILTPGLSFDRSRARS